MFLWFSARMLKLKSSSPRARNHALDAWRGLAALAVLGAHLSDSLATFYPDSPFRHGGGLEAFLLHGQIGVDIFFLISGYIVFLSALRFRASKKRDIASFLSKRVIRIYAPYLPVAILLGLAYSVLPSISKAGEPRVVNWIKSLTLFPIAGDYSLSVAWTLSYEMFFYCIVACSIAFAGSIKKLIVAAIPSLTVIAYFLLSGRYGVGGTSNPWELLSSPYNLEFFAGCVLAFAVFQASQNAESKHLSGFPLGTWFPKALYFAAIILMLMPFQNGVVYRFLLLSLVALTISPLASASISRLRICNILAALGLFSYSLYLVHNPLQSLLVRMSVWLGLPSLFSAVALVFIPVACAFVYYISVESKSLELIKLVPDGAKATAA